MSIDPDLRNVLTSFMLFVCQNMAILVPKIPLPCLPWLSAGNLMSTWSRGIPGKGSHRELPAPRATTQGRPSRGETLRCTMAVARPCYTRIDARSVRPSMGLRCSSAEDKLPWALSSSYGSANSLAGRTSEGAYGGCSGKLLGLTAEICWRSSSIVAERQVHSSIRRSRSLSQCWRSRWSACQRA